MRNVLIVFLIFTAVSAKAQSYSCPATLQVQQSAAAVPDTWNAIVMPDLVHFDSVSFYNSNPIERALLVPDGTSKVKGEERSTWTFHPQKGEAFWIGCSYEGTRVVLGQKLKPEVTSCVVRYDLLPTGRRLKVKGIICR